MKKYITILTIALIVSALAVAVWAETTMPFEDVPENAYYTEAVLWAYDNGITICADREDQLMRYGPTEETDALRKAAFANWRGRSSKTRKAVTKHENRRAVL